MRSQEATEATVFIVEPDETARDKLRALLGRLPAHVHTFADGDAFLRQIDAAIQGACLVCELELPDMNALQLLARLRERGSNIAALVLARDTDVSTAVLAMRAGAVDFIEKPYADGVLVHRVREALRRAAG